MNDSVPTQTLTFHEHFAHQLATNSASELLNMSVSALKGVNERLARALRASHVRTVRDLALWPVALSACKLLGESLDGVDLAQHKVDAKLRAQFAAPHATAAARATAAVDSSLAATSSAVIDVPLLPIDGHLSSELLTSLGRLRTSRVKTLRDLAHWSSFRGALLTLRAERDQRLLSSSSSASSSTATKAKASSSIDVDALVELVSVTLGEQFGGVATQRTNDGGASSYIALRSEPTHYASLLELGLDAGVRPSALLELRVGGAASAGVRVAERLVRERDLHLSSLADARDAVELARRRAIDAAAAADVNDDATKAKSAQRRVGNAPSSGASMIIFNFESFFLKIKNKK